MNVVFPQVYTQFSRSKRKEGCLNASPRTGSWQDEGGRSPHGAAACCCFRPRLFRLQVNKNPLLRLCTACSNWWKFSQGGRRLPLRPFPHTADGLEERLLVWALRQSKQNILKHFIFNRVSGRYRLKWTHAVASCYYSWSLFIDLGLVNVTIVELILCMVVVPRWFCWPMWLPTEALPPSTLTSMHWRWHQHTTLLKDMFHLMWQEVHQDEMEILGVPCAQFFNVSTFCLAQS